MTHPIALICYNRPAHLSRVLDALARIQPEPLYIFSDGAKDCIEDTERVRQVRELLLGIQWTAPVITIGGTNRGIAHAIPHAVDYVLERHDTVIVLEDDCVPGPYLYDFMVGCLEKYEHEDEVMAVSGYAYRLPVAAFEDYEYDVHFFPRIETWGWATWRGAWEHYIRDRDLASTFEQAQRLGVDLTAGGDDIPAIIHNRLGRGVDSWSPGWLLGTAMAGGLTVYPTLSYIRYVGDDGSGANMPASGRWGTDMATERVTRLPDWVQIHQLAYQAMKAIFDGL